MRFAVLRSLLPLAPLAAMVGCYASRDLPPATTPDGCVTDEEPRCAVRRDGPCGARTLSEANCIEERWQCPPGARAVFEHEDAGRCLPFAGAVPRLITMGPTLALGSRCVTMINGAPATLASPLDHLGVALDDALPIGGCPAGDEVIGNLLDRSLVGDDIIVDVMDTVTWEGDAFSLVRLFVTDPGAVFGVTAMGSGFVSHDSNGRFAPSRALRWRDGLHRSALVVGDTLYVFVSLGETGLSGGVGVLRASVNNLVDVDLPYERWNGDAWVPGEDAPAAVFDAGPHFHVSHHPGGALLVVTADGFGDRIDSWTAEDPEGPYRRFATTLRCNLPADDPEAFCDSPRAHPFFFDEARPTEAVVSYRIGTLATDQARRMRERPRAYWGRLAAATVLAATADP